MIFMLIFVSVFAWVYLWIRRRGAPCACLSPTRPRIALPTIRRCETAYIIGPTGAPEVAHPNVGGRCLHCGEPPYNHAGPFDPPPPCDVLNGAPNV